MATRKRCTVKRARKGLCTKKASRKHSTHRCRHTSGRLKGKFKRCGR